MNAYIYCADSYCEDCAGAIKRRIPYYRRPTNPEIESTYDSDDWPKGPFPDGGGEADTPQHCGACGVFLENPLTTDGCAYVREQLAPYVSPGDCELGEQRRADMIADRAAEDGNPVLATWAREYPYIWAGC